MNEDQIIVLRYLKSMIITSEDFPMWAIGIICDFVTTQDNKLTDKEKSVRDSFQNLTVKEQFEVLAAFAEWGLKQ